MPVEEQVDGRAVDELEALPGDGLPMVGRNALAHDPPGDRDELQVEVLDPQLVDLRADLLDQIIAPRGVDEGLDVHRRLAGAQPGPRVPRLAR